MKPGLADLFSAVGMPLAHVSAKFGLSHDGVTMRCGLLLRQWRGPDGKPICKRCLRYWRKWNRKKGGAS